MMVRRGPSRGSLHQADGLKSPDGIIAGPDGNLYVSSSGSDKVMRYDGDTGLPMGAFASGSPLRAPSGLTFGPDGDLYVSSLGSNQILRYNGSTGAYRRIFSSGAGVNRPTGILFGPDGNLYVASAGTDRILRYDGNTGRYTDWFTVCGLNRPAYMALRIVPEPSSVVALLGGMGALAGLVRRRHRRTR